MTMLINLGMHDFWNQYPNTDTGHEMQNFFKNLGIFAGLLVMSASAKINQWRLFNQR
jgi:putative oxidoreductase